MHSLSVQDLRHNFWTLSNALITDRDTQWMLYNVFILYFKAHWAQLLKNIFSVKKLKQIQQKLISKSQNRKWKEVKEIDRTKYD